MAQQWWFMLLPIIGVSLVGCIPRIEVTPPKEPVTINMNVKIDHEIHITADGKTQELVNKAEE